MATKRNYTDNLCVGGTAICDSYDSTLSFSSDKAFDNDDSTCWSTMKYGAGNNGAAWIGYHFTSAKKIAKISWFTPHPNEMPSSIKVQASNNGSTWTTIQQFDNLPLSAWIWIDLVIDSIPITGYTYWRLLCNSSLNGYGSFMVYEIKMYECTATDIPVNRAMIQSPYDGYSYCSDYAAGYEYYNCFNYELDGKYWKSASNCVAGSTYIEFNFLIDRRIQKIRIYPVSPESNVTSIIVQPHNLSTPDYNIQQFDNIVTTTGQWIDLNITNISLNYTKFKTWRLLANSTTTSGPWQIRKIQFYELADVISSSSIIMG